MERRRPKSQSGITGSKSGRNLKTLEGIFSDKGMHFKTIQPGYMLSKRKSGINVTLNMEELCTSDSKAKRKSSSMQDERDMLIKTLQQEIENLNISLTEERVSYKSQFEQFFNNTKIDIEVMKHEHREHVKVINEDHREELDKLAELYEAKLKAGKDEAKSKAAHTQEEFNLVKESLKSCKEEVTCEMEEKWIKEKKQLESDYELKTEELLALQKLKLKGVRNAELNNLKQEHEVEVDKLVDQRHKEMNTLLEKFAVCAADTENLRITLFEAEKLKEEVEDLREVCARTKEQLRKTQNELADAKVKLQGYELSFSDKVTEVEERYSLKIHGLMLNNTDIRRNYMKKCAELMDVQTKNHCEQEKIKNDTKSTMKTIILARTKANISLVNPYQSSNSASQNIKNPAASGTSRPKSAPAARRRTWDDLTLSAEDRWAMNYRSRSGLA